MLGRVKGLLLKAKANRVSGFPVRTNSWRLRLSKRLAAKPAKANRVSALQYWKRCLPVGSGADNLMALRVREMKVKPSKRLAAKSAKANRFSAFQYWKRKSSSE
jgi:hypothetical protein